MLLLDQFPRQIWRGEAKAFAGDPQALQLSLEALERGWIAAESQRPRRQFWLMPQLTAKTQRAASGDPLLERHVDEATANVARRHLLQLQRFGRYPHRNAALGRVSSPEEVVSCARLKTRSSARNTPTRPGRGSTTRDRR
ncbi:MAG: hypothetical protein CM15mP39_01040 [Synechococcus sp.]|nr:MAG: hypothetical protein CM15mP39_01040 [Synechococcus sp.]